MPQGTDGAHVLRRNPKGTRGEDFPLKESVTTFDHFLETLKTLGIPLIHGTDGSRDREAQILEVGAGVGLLLGELQKRGYRNVKAVDAHPRGPGVRQGMIEKMEEGDASVDVVISIGAFDSTMYDQNQPGMVEEIARVLKPDGIFLADTELAEQMLHEGKPLVTAHGTLDFIDTPEKSAVMGAAPFYILQKSLR